MYMYMYSIRYMHIYMYIHVHVLKVSAVIGYVWCNMLKVSAVIGYVWCNMLKVSAVIGYVWCNMLKVSAVIGYVWCNMLKGSAVIHVGYVSMVSMVLCTFSLQEELWWSGDLCELSHLPVPRRAERPPAVSFVKTAQQLVHTLCKTYGIMHVYGYTYSIYILVFHTAHPKQSPHMYTHTVQDIA